MAFSDDPQTVRSAVYMGDAAGKTSLYNALLQGLDHVQRGTCAKKTLIIVSDGGDNASKASKADVLTKVSESEVTVYTVRLFTDEDPGGNRACCGMCRN